jgi:hypothetical protein
VARDESTAPAPLGPHENIRGADYYDTTRSKKRTHEPVH